MPAPGLSLGGLAAVVAAAETAPVLRVVGVEVEGDQLAAAVGPVVSDDAGLGAAVVHAGGVLGEDAGSEAVAVVAVVAAGVGAAAGTFGVT